MDKSADRMLTVIGIVGIITGVFNILIGFIAKYLLVNNIKEINVLGVSNYIMDRFMRNGFRFMIVGILSLIVLEVLKKVYTKKIAS